MIKSVFSNKVIQNIISLGAATLVSAALSFVVGVVTRNILGPEKYGYWLTISLIFTFIPLFQLGTVNAMNREVPFYKARGDYNKVREIKNLTLSFIFTIPLLLGIVLFIFSLAFLFVNYPFEYKIGFLYASILSILVLLSVYIEMYFKSEQKFRIASGLISLKSISQSILTVVFVYMLGYQGLFIGMGIALIIQLVAGRSSLKEFNFQADAKKIKELIKTGFPILLVGMVWSILIASDRIIISIFMTPQDLGNYGIGMLIFNSMMLLPQVIGQVYYPKIVEMVSKNEFKEIYRQFWKVNSILAVVIGIVVGILYIIFPWFVKIYLPEYVNGITTGQILIIGIFPLTLMGYAANYFNATKNQKSYISIQMITIALNIILSLLFLTFHFHISAIAIATSLSYLIYFLLMNYYFITKIKIEIRERF